MGNQITICHYNESGHWDAIEVATSALNGHDGHDLDIWGPVEGVTPGHNWPKGEAIYLNGCVLETTVDPSPSPSPSPSSSLPETGIAVADMLSLLMSLVLVITGALLIRTARRRGR